MRVGWRRPRPTRQPSDWTGRITGLSFREVASNTFGGRELPSQFETVSRFSPRWAYLRDRG